MNRAYRLIWNELDCCWVAVAEIVSGRGKRSGAALLVAGALLVTAQPALAAGPAASPAATQLPVGGQVVAGSALITPGANATLTVRQDSARAAIDWQRFDIGAGATVRFVQPGADSATLNRVTSADPSQIFGRISANGQVFLTNPQGIYFSPSASVDVGGLVATTHGIANDDFITGRMVLSRNGATGSVVNDGQLEAALRGYIALLAPEVRNQGLIVARLGTVALAAGERFELHFDAHSLAGVSVTPATIAALVDNGNAVHAPGGLIILSAQAASRLQAGIVRNSGVAEATGLVNDGGVIRLLASDRIEQTGALRADAAAGIGQSGHGGRIELIADPANPASVTRVGGAISARGGAAGGDGGEVETSASRVKVDALAHVDTRAAQGRTGRWTIDPDGFSVAASGGDISGADLSTQLTTTDVAIASTSGGGSDGAIHVNDTVNWSANALALTATGNVDINAVMTASGSASLALNAGSGSIRMGQDGSGRFIGRVDFPGRSGDGFLSLNGVATTVISALGDEGSRSGVDLQGLSGALGGHFALGADINAEPASNWDAGQGFRPIGLAADGSSASFTGSFDGLGHQISALTIQRPTAATPSGLFGALATGARISNLGLDQVNVVGANQVGALAGTAAAEINAVVVRGSVSGFDDVGGVVGSASGHSIAQVIAAVSVSGAGSAVGGVAGRNDAGTINHAQVSGNVEGAQAEVGGLVGHNSDTGVITASSATAIVNGGSGSVGGLVGFNSGTLRAVYASGGVSAAGDAVGGLVGMSSGGSISDAHADGLVGSISGSAVGGLVGLAQNTSLSNVYATGAVSGSAGQVGGLVGYADASPVLNAFATGKVDGTGASQVGGLIGAASNSTVTNAYATGRVDGDGSVGGLIGDASELKLNGVYSAGSVNGNTAVGRLVGYFDSNSTITQAYSIASVNGSETAPLVGFDTGIGTSISQLIGSEDTRLNAWTGAASTGEWTAFDPQVTADPNWSLGHAPTIFETAVFANAQVAIPGVVMAKDLNASADTTLRFSGDTVSSLSLGRDKRITVDATLAFGAAGRLNLTGGDSLVLSRGGLDYVVVQSLGASGDEDQGDKATLQGMANASMLGRNFVLGLDIDAAETSTWPIGVATVAGFYPIGRLFNSLGDPGQAFTANFDGLGHAVNGLTISRANGSDGQGVGLFGWVHAGSDPAVTQSLSNLRLIEPNIFGHSDVGALVGTWDSAGGAGLISGVQVERGNVVGAIDTSGGFNDPAARIGGVAGSLVGATIAISASAANAQVGNAFAFSHDVGGLVGASDGAIRASTSSGQVSAGSSTPGETAFNIGGLVGQAADVSTSSSSSLVIAAASARAVGGLIGAMSPGATVSNSSAAGEIRVGEDGSNAVSEIGGLVGHGDGVLTQLSSRTRIVVSGDAFGVGGLVGIGAGTITNADSSGEISVSGAAQSTGGLAGEFRGDIRDVLAMGKVSVGASSTVAGLNAKSVGGLIGNFEDGALNAAHSTGAVIAGDGASEVGGLIGRMATSDASLAVSANGVASSGDVRVGNAAAGIGGLVGVNFGLLANANSSSAVMAGANSAQIGGLVGLQSGASISHSSASGEVRICEPCVGPALPAAGQSIGGLVGDATAASLTAVQASGRVSVGNGAQNVGGLVGYANNSHIADASASGAVEVGIATSEGSGSTTAVGGLLGGLYVDASIADAQDILVRSTASGAVTAKGESVRGVGGLVGQVTGDGSIPVSLIDVSASGAVTVSAGAGEHRAVGGLLGEATDDNATVSELARAHASGAVSASGPGVQTGGLVGRADGANIQDSDASGAVSGNAQVGGLAGSANGSASLVHVSAVGDVSGVADVGGLIGVAIADSPTQRPFVIGAHASGRVGGDDAVGGLVGLSDGAVISASSASGDVSGGVGSRRIGGLIGYAGVNNADFLSAVSASGAVSAPGGSEVGGLIGRIDQGDIEDAFASGAVSGGDRVGGLVGNNAANLLRSHASGRVAGSANDIGGLVGTHSGTISDSWAEGDVVGLGDNVGGLVGSSVAGQVSRSFATGAVSGVNAVGGLIGASDADSTLADAYASGPVNGNDGVGGLIGVASGGSIARTYAFGAVSGTANVGGLIGSADVTTVVADSYWDQETSGQTDSAGGVGKTTLQMTAQDTYQGFDFSSPSPVWAIHSSRNNSYPTLCLAGAPCTSDGGSGWAGTVTALLLDVTESQPGSVYGSNVGVFGVALFDGATPADLGSIGVSLAGSAQFNGAPTAASDVGNYNITYGSGISLAGVNGRHYKLTPRDGVSYSITPAPLSIRADDITKTYDGKTVDQAPTASFNGFVLNQDASVLGGVLAFGGNWPGAVNAGTYSIVPSGLSSTNYAISFVDGALTINKAHLTLSADDQNRLYGQANPALTLSLAGFVNGEDAASASVSGAGMASTDAVATTPVGTVTIHADIGSLTAQNYDFTAVDGVLTINKAHLTLTADDLSRLYGQANPALTLSLTGFVNGEDAASANLSGSGLASTTAVATTPVGTVPIHAEVGSLDAQNYDFTPIDGTLTINKAHLTLTADDLTRLYGQANPALTLSLTGFVNGEDAASASVSGAGMASTDAVATTPVGTLPIHADIGSLAAQNYDFTPVDGVLTINKAHLTLTADDLTRLYGQANPELTMSLAGFVNGEDVASANVSGAGSATTTAVATTPVGTVAIHAETGTLTAQNYDFTAVDGLLTIDKAHLSVTADDQSRLYGQANPLLTLTISGFVNGENPGSAGVSGTATASTDATESAGVGSYTISADAGTLAARNYDFSAFDGVLTINKAHLTLAADDQSRLYGQANPALTLSLSGFVNGEDVDSALVSGNASASTAAVVTTPVGRYAIAADIGSLDAPNYDFTAQAGTLTIDKAHLTVKADDKTRRYGQTNPALTISVTGFVNGEDAASAAVVGAGAATSTAVATTPAGAWAIAAQVGSLAAANYDFTAADGTLTIAKATLSVTADDKTRPFNRVNPPLTATLAGFVNGETEASAGISGSAALSTPAKPSSPLGTQPITAQAGSLLAANYDFSGIAGVLTITAEPTGAELPLRLDRYPTAAPAIALKPEAFEFVPSALRTPGVVSAEFDGLALVVVKRGDASQAGVVAVTLPRDLVSAGRGFALELPVQVMSSADSVGAVANLANGEALPAWLHFDAAARSFSATNLPSGSLPLEIVIKTPGRQIRVQISQRLSG